MESKKFFTKYLPIEGEPKDGDFVKYHDNFGNIDFFGTLVIFAGDYEIRFKNGGRMGILFKEYCIKVKLFLCSKDIQIGDLCCVPNEGGQDLINKYTLVSKTDTYENFEGGSYGGLGIFSGKSYKIIGEISPISSKWVKDGDEFDEEEAQLCYQPGGEDSETWNLVPWNMISILPEDRHRFYTMVKIKCPNCDVFH